MTENDRQDRAERAFSETFERHAAEPNFEPLTLPVEVSSRPASRFPLRRLLPVAAAFLVAAVAGLAVLNLPGSNPAGPAAARAPMAERGPADETTAESGDAGASARPGWRFESYRNLQIQVPGSWGYAFSPGTDWCAARRQQAQRPYVDRGPNRVVLTIGCPEQIQETRLTIFVTFSEGAWSAPWKLPAGWAATSRTLNNTTATVVHPTADAGLADRILATATTISSDHNGCHVRSAIQGNAFKSPVPASDLARIASAESIAVCQYDLKSRGAGLLGSRQLKDPSRVLRQLKDAPIGGGPDDPAACVPADVGSTAIVLRISDRAVVSEVFLYYEGCRNNGFFDGTSARELTRDACVPLTGGRVWIGIGHAPSISRCREEPTPTSTGG